jgi:uncharacterized pyridoxal phosphate-containing UPF0001 family protein
MLLPLMLFPYFLIPVATNNTLDAVGENKFQKCSGWMDGRKAKSSTGTSQRSPLVIDAHFIGQIQ